MCETQSERTANGSIRCSDQPVGVRRTFCGQLHTVPHLHFRLLLDKRSSSTIRAQREPLRPDGKRIPNCSGPTVCSSTPTRGATVLSALHELRSPSGTQHADGPCVFGCPSCIRASARTAFSSGAHAHGAHLSHCHYLIMFITNYKWTIKLCGNKDVSGILSWMISTNIFCIHTNAIMTDIRSWLVPFYDVLILLIGVYLHEHLIVCSAVTDCNVIYNRLENKFIFIGNLFDCLLILTQKYEYFKTCL